MKYRLVPIFLGASLSYGDDTPAQVVVSELDLHAIPIEDPGHSAHKHDHANHRRTGQDRLDEPDRANTDHLGYEHGESCDHDVHDHKKAACGATGHDGHTDHCDHASVSQDHALPANHSRDGGHDDHAGHGHHRADGRENHDAHPWYEHDCNAFTLDDPNLGGFLFPTFYAYGAFGESSADQEELASGHHDPQGSATLQTLEPAITLQAGHVRGFTTATGYTDSHGEFTLVLEEGYLGLVDLPGGIEIRGGQFLNPFGFQNARHIHDWNFVDQNLVNGRFFNEGDLATQGGEILFSVTETSRLRAYYGGVATHGGHHHHHEEEARYAFEAEGAEFRDEMFGATYETELRFDDGRSIAGVVSGLWGDNAFAQQTQVYGAGLEYCTVHNDRPLRIRGEAMFRDIDAIAGHLPGEAEEEHDGHEHEEDHDHQEHEEIVGLYHDGDHASFDEFGFSAAILYGLNDRTEIGVRADWISGIDEFGMDDRFRVSPVLTWYANAERTIQCRLQYNHDISDGFGSENSIWFQVGLNWPGHHSH